MTQVAETAAVESVHLTRDVVAGPCLYAPECQHVLRLHKVVGDRIVCRWEHCDCPGYGFYIYRDDDGALVCGTRDRLDSAPGDA